MFRLRNAALACSILVIGALFAQAQDNDLKAVLRKSIQAHGGEKNLNKFQAATSKSKGTMKISGVELNIVLDVWLQKPNKLRKVMTLEQNGKSVEITQVYDGKSFWVHTGGKTMEIKDEKILKELHDALQVEGTGSLVEFLKAPYELSAIGEVKVKDQDTIGIRVSKKGQRDVSYYFDKKTHLIVKTESRGLDPSGTKEATQEKFIVGYQEKNGMQVAKRIVVHTDGEHFMDLEVSDVQAFEKLDDSLFLKP